MFGGGSVGDGGLGEGDGVEVTGIGVQSFLEKSFNFIISGVAIGVFE